MSKEICETLDIIDKHDIDMKIRTLETFLKEKGLWPEYIFFEIKVQKGLGNLSRYFDRIEGRIKDGTYPMLSNDVEVILQEDDEKRRRELWG